MSIYATWLSIDDDNHATACHSWIPVAEGDPWAMVTNDGQHYRYDAAAVCTCGELAPIVYQGSHVNPSENDKRGGCVLVCAIPNHCHPDARGTDDAGAPVDYLRLKVKEDPATYQFGAPGDATVVLTKRHVTELRDTLSVWLDAEDRS